MKRLADVREKLKKSDDVPPPLSFKSSSLSRRRTTRSPPPEPRSRTVANLVTTGSSTTSLSTIRKLTTSTSSKISTTDRLHLSETLNRHRASSVDSLGRAAAADGDRIARAAVGDPKPDHQRSMAIVDSMRNLKKISSAEVMEEKAESGSFYDGAAALLNGDAAMTKKKPIVGIITPKLEDAVDRKETDTVMHRNSTANSDWFAGKYEKLTEHYQDIISRFRASLDNMVWAYDALQHETEPPNEEKVRLRQLLFTELRVAHSRLGDRVHQQHSSRSPSMSPVQSTSFTSTRVLIGENKKDEAVGAGASKDQNDRTKPQEPVDPSVILQQYTDLLVTMIKQKMST